MSLLPQATNANATTAYFLKANAQLINVSTLNAGSISSNTIGVSSLEADFLSTIDIYASQGTISTFSTSQIVIDAQTLNATPTELLLNGIPLATLSSLSSIADWSYEPAVSSVQMMGNDLNEAGLVSSLNVRAGNGLFNNLVAFNSLFVSSNTSTISSLIESADLGIFSTLNAGEISSGAISCTSLAAPLGTISSLAGDLANFSTISCVSLSSLVGSVSSLKTDEIFASSFTTDTISTNSLAVSSINGSEFTSTGIIVQVAGVSSLVANSISSVGAEIRNALVSTIQFKPSFDVGLNFDTAALGNALQGGLTRLGIGAGVGFGVVGSGLLGAVFSRPANTSYNTNAYYQYAVPTQLQFSTLGADTSSFTRLVSSSGAGNEVPGVEIVLSSIISSGTLCLRSLGDPTNLADPSTFTSSIQAFGEWVPVPPEALAVSSFASASVSSLSVSSINNAVYPPPAVIPEDWANYPAISTINFSTGITAVVAASAGSDIALSGTAIKLIGGYTDAQNLLLVSSLSTATILGANDNLFGLGLPGLKIDAPNLFFSTIQTNITGLTNTSTLGAVNLQARNGGISSLEVSSLSFAQAGAFGLSSLMFLSTAALPGFGTSSCLVANTDFSVGQNDIYAQQIRLGYLNVSSQPSEIIFHSPNNTQRAFNLGNSDQTIRLQSTANATTAGYLLDTQVNPPFFSTINQSTCLMAYFPSTTSGTIGISTISFQPPKVVAGNFLSLSTQALTANTPLVLWPETTDFTTGGISLSTSAIVIPSDGIYEFATSIQFSRPAGNGQADFWFRVNGADVPNSGSEIAMPSAGAGQTLGNVVFTKRLNTGDKLQLCVGTPDTGVSATFFQSTVAGAPYAKPAVPSLILSVKCLNY